MMRLRLFILVPFFIAPLICFHPSNTLAQEKKPLGDPIVIELIELDYANAEELASVLSPFLSKEGRVMPYTPTNTLIIKDKASIVKRLREIIKGRAENF